MLEETKAAIDAFIRDRPSNPCFGHHRWITNSEIHLYLRVGFHMADGRAYRFLDIASVDVTRPGQGLFTEILEYCQAVTPFAGVFVEIILNERLMEHMKRLQAADHRWVQCDQSFAWLKGGGESDEEKPGSANEKNDLDRAA
jgi:hypothetical protein